MRLLLFKPNEDPISVLIAPVFLKLKRNTQYFLSEHETAERKKAVEQGKNQTCQGGKGWPTLMHKPKSLIV